MGNSSSVIAQLEEERSTLMGDLELAEDTRKARYIKESEIEIAEELPSDLDIQNVILDHDGTISTLREGWEIVMHQVMMEVICGSNLDKLTTDEYNLISK